MNGSLSPMVHKTIRIRLSRCSGWNGCDGMGDRYAMVGESFSYVVFCFALKKMQKKKKVTK